MNTVSKITAMAIVALMAITPFMLCDDSDAAGFWWNDTTDIDIKAGSSFEYTAVNAPNGKEITSLEIESNLKDCFTINGKDVKAYFPWDTPAGDYDAVLIANTVSGQYWMKFVFHISEPSDVSTGYAANVPSVDKVEISQVGNNAKVAYITVNTTNVSKLKFDFSDNICTDYIQTNGGSMTISHRFANEGLYAMNITAYNSYGETQKVVVYNCGEPSGEKTLKVTNIKAVENADANEITLKPIIIATLGTAVDYEWSYKTKDMTEAKKITAENLAELDFIKNSDPAEASLILDTEKLDAGTKFTVKVSTTFDGDEEPTVKSASYTYMADKTFFDEHGYLFIVFAVIALLLVVAIFYFGFQTPVAYAGLAIAVVLAILLFMYKDFNGLFDAVTDLFKK